MSPIAGAKSTAPRASLDDVVAVDQHASGAFGQHRSHVPPRRRGWVLRRMLLVADVLGLLLAFACATILFEPVASVDRVAWTTEMSLFLFSLPAWVVLAKLHGLYDRDGRRADHSTVDDIVGVFHLVTVGAWLFYISAAATGLAHPPLARIVGFWGFAIVSVTVGRALARARCRRSVSYVQNTIILGAGDVGQLTARKLLAHPEYGLNLVGFVDRQPRERRDDLGHLTLLGPPEQLSELIDLLDVERVIVAFSNDSNEETLALIRWMMDLDVQVDIVPRLFEILGAGAGIHTVEGVPLVGLRRPRLSRSSRLLKRGMDVTFSALGLLVLGPVFAAIAVAIKVDARGPVYFRQTRMGEANKTFRIYKFRTMSTDADARKAHVAHLNMHAGNGGDPRMFKIPNDPRVTRVGMFLRRYSLDELPQLINVLRGEMSLVGPRPLILDEDQHVETWARKRLALRPGITGLWQVLGRSEIPFEEMTKLDYVYVTNWSIAEDLRLMFLTLPALLRPRKAY